MPFCDKSCRFGKKVAVFRTLTAVWGIKCRFRDDFFVKAIFGNFFKFLRQFFQILTAKLGCPTYEERPEKLILFSLARRRLRGDLILAYNLSNGSFDLPIEEFFTRPPCSSLRGHSLKLHHRRFRLNRRKVAFSVRIVEPWNKLPAFVVGSLSVDVFESRLNACWTEVYAYVI